MKAWPCLGWSKATDPWSPSGLQQRGGRPERRPAFGTDAAEPSRPACRLQTTSSHLVAPSLRDMRNRTGPRQERTTGQPGRHEGLNGLTHATSRPSVSCHLEAPAHRMSHHLRQPGPQEEKAIAAHRRAPEASMGSVSFDLGDEKRVGQLGRRTPARWLSARSPEAAWR